MVVEEGKKRAPVLETPSLTRVAVGLQYQSNKYYRSQKMVRGMKYGCWCSRVVIVVVDALGRGCRCVRARLSMR